MNTLIKLGEVLAILSIIGGFFVWWMESTARTQSRITEAWTLLAIPISGNFGKTNALEYLNSVGERFGNIDLSCKTTNGGWNEETMSCANRPQLIAANLENSDFSGAKMSGIWIFGGKFNGANLTGVDFRGSRIMATRFDGSSLVGANFEGSEMTHSTFRDVELSNANFKNTEKVSLDFEGAWAWDDIPPKGLDGWAIELCEFNKKITSRAEQFSEKPPVGCHLTVM